MLGYHNAKVTMPDTYISTGKADYTIRKIKSKRHFQLGTSSGELLFEPYKYNNPANMFTGEASQLRDITIKLGNEKE